MMYAEIAIYQAPLNRTFHYSVPESITAQVGQLVEVEFRTGISQGIIVAFSDSSPVPHTKPIHQIIVSEPVVSPVQIALAHWMAEQTLSSLSACLWLTLPPGLAKKGDVQFTLLDPDYPADDSLTGQVAALLKARGPLRAAQIRRALPGTDWRTGLRPLIARGIVLRQPVLPVPDAHVQMIRTARLAIRPEHVEEALDDLNRSPKQAAILRYLLDFPDPVPTRDVLEATDASAVSLKQLADKGLIRLEEQEHVRDPLAGRVFEGGEIPQLTPGQQAAWDRIREHLDRLRAGQDTPRTFLLHGVTGSGKTEIYLRALDSVLRQGRQAIVLVPEISLVPQQVQRFAARFPDQVSVIHSSLTDGEQYDTWRRARDGQIDVVIGARSALFAPLRDVGLIIIDEEHDDSYKQSPPLPPPYYHARDAAIAMMRLNRGTVILGSATPGVVTVERAGRGEIEHLRLPFRVNRRRAAHTTAPLEPTALDPNLPPVDVVDMRQELRAGNRSMFSRSLREALQHTLKWGEQAILFLNRRGNASFVLCRDCGYVAKCPRCEMPLTWHAANTALLCHSCGHREPQITLCPSCGSQRIRYFGAGTASVEEAVRTEFAPVRVLRWDRDTTQERGAHETLMTRFAAGEADVLVGTQMIVKGLDLPRVTLVGVILADTALGMPDYRAGERTFQLLTQAAGRADRADLPGRVIFQTYQPDHYAIRAASEHDYDTFYDREIVFRRELHYPPFRRLVRFVCRHDSPAKAQQEAEHAADWLRSHIQERQLTATDLIGPAPTFFGRIGDVFSWHVIARTTDPVLLTEGWTPRAGTTVDIDPLDIL